jgi:hypothetical protein
MKRSAAAFLALCLAASLSACSSLPAQKPDYAAAKSCDYELMARLEHMAKQERAELHWVNCPQLSASASRT